MKALGTLVLFLLLVSGVGASNHYTFEHAEDMRTSGRVDWRDYEAAAFTEAIEQNKPIFLMLTAPSWCYWCHVYTSDDYVYHPNIYPTINEKYIPIYVDADKRQDLTRQYLEGGWPSTTVLTPGRERLFGYSGPRPHQFMLDNLNNAADFVSQQGFANSITYSYQKLDPIMPSNEQLQNIINQFAGYLLQVHDQEQGGFGTGQKFPQGRSLDYALDLYELTNNQRFLNVVTNTLEHQYTQADELDSNYNLYDPLDGGFHRYGTTRTWTPPHYEKMLYDNVRLLKAYVHLQQHQTDNAILDEVVEGTKNFIKTQWYDSKEGGFFGNSDVHGEHVYFHANPRPADKPRVEKTKYADWNTDAVLAYLYLWQTEQEAQYRDMAAATLDFFQKHMVDENGAYHYYNEQGEKDVQGSLLDNSYLTLMFIEGYGVLGDTSHLETAEQLAQYSLENLYDWYGGGFFERNSQDKEAYAPGEEIDLAKPTPENGVMALAMLKLFRATDDPTYLAAGLKTLGRKMGEVSSLDRGYFYPKAAEYALQHNLLGAYQARIEEIVLVENEKQKEFWVNSLVIDNAQAAPEFVVSDEGLEKLEGPILILMLVALIAGFISFISPCTLPIVPAYVAYAFRSSKKNIKSMTFFFFLGLATVFTLIGMTATVIGNFLRVNLTIFTQVAGALLILFGLLIILGKGFHGFKVKQIKPKSYGGAYAFGAMLGISWTPCEGFILVSIGILASTAGSVLTGGLLLFVYALGLAIPLILISLYLEKKQDSKIWKIIEGKEITLNLFGKRRYFHTTNIVSGILFIMLGYLIFSGILFAFNQYVAATQFQSYIFRFEEWLLNLIK